MKKCNTKLNSNEKKDSVNAKAEEIKIKCKNKEKTQRNYDSNDDSLLYSAY